MGWTAYRGCWAGVHVAVIDLLLQEGRSLLVCAFLRTLAVASCRMPGQAALHQILMLVLPQQPAVTPRLEPTQAA